MEKSLGKVVTKKARCQDCEGSEILPFLQLAGQPGSFVDAGGLLVERQRSLLLHRIAVA